MLFMGLVQAFAWCFSLPDTELADEVHALMLAMAKRSVRGPGARGTLGFIDNRSSKLLRLSNRCGRPQFVEPAACAKVCSALKFGRRRLWFFLAGVW